MRHAASASQVITRGRLTFVQIDGCLRRPLNQILHGGVPADHIDTLALDLCAYRPRRDSASKPASSGNLAQIADRSPPPSAWERRVISATPPSFQLVVITSIIPADCRDPAPLWHRRWCARSLRSGSRRRCGPAWPAGLKVQMTRASHAALPSPTSKPARIGRSMSRRGKCRPVTYRPGNRKSSYSLNTTSPASALALTHRQRFFPALACRVPAFWRTVSCFNSYAVRALHLAQRFRMGIPIASTRSCRLVEKQTLLTQLVTMTNGAADNTAQHSLDHRWTSRRRQSGTSNADMIGNHFQRRAVDISSAGDFFAHSGSMPAEQVVS